MLLPFLTSTTIVEGWKHIIIYRLQAAEAFSGLGLMVFKLMSNAATILYRCVNGNESKVLRYPFDEVLSNTGQI